MTLLRDTGYMSSGRPLRFELSTLGYFMLRTSSQELSVYDVDPKAYFVATGQVRSPENVTFHDTNQRGHRSHRSPSSLSAYSSDDDYGDRFQMENEPHCAGRSSGGKLHPARPATVGGWFWRPAPQWRGYSMTHFADRGIRLLR